MSALRAYRPAVVRGEQVVGVISRRDVEKALTTAWAMLRQKGS
jgi:CBS domain-containing protein